MCVNLALEFEKLSRVSDCDGERKPGTNPERTVAGSSPIFYVPILFQLDDVSGNRSKQWNLHYAQNFTNATLNRKLMLSERCLKFFAISQHAHPLELMEEFVKQMK
jgi:hypothetical protein